MILGVLKTPPLPPSRKTKLGGGIRKGEVFDCSGRNGGFETKRMKPEQDPTRREGRRILLVDVRGVQTNDV